MSGGDEKQLKQFIEAGADNVIQKPAKTDTLVNILLTGLEMVVVFNETHRFKPTTVSSVMMNISSELARQEHMEHLLQFLTSIKAKTKVLPVLVPAPAL